MLLTYIHTLWVRELVAFTYFWSYVQWDVTFTFWGRVENNRQLTNFPGTYKNSGIFYHTLVHILKFIFYIVCMCVPQHTCGSPRVCGSEFSPPMWVSGIELGSSVGSAFTSWVFYLIVLPFVNTLPSPQYTCGWSDGAWWHTRAPPPSQRASMGSKHFMWRH